MKLSAKTHRLILLQNILFIVLFISIIGLLAYASYEYRYQSDWTHGNRNTLNPATQTLLQNLEGPITITAFVETDAELHKRIRDTISKYQRYKADFQLEFVDPNLQPSRAQAAGITRAGQLVLAYQGRSESVEDMGEQTLANSLQRLARNEIRPILFLTGHEERSLDNADADGLLQLADLLQKTGNELQTINLIRSPQIPIDSAFLVIASPQRALLPGEVASIQDYVARGGNLLWLQDPGSLQGLLPLAQDLGLEFPAGTIVDANQELRMLLGVSHPAVIPVIDYGVHKITENLSVQTLFPFAGSLQNIENAENEWLLTPFLQSLPQTWAETNSLEGDVYFDETEGDLLGPLTIGAILERDMSGSQQRVIVITDADFLANAYLGAGGNLDLTTMMFNWLNSDDQLLNIPAQRAPDTRIDLDYNSAIALGIFFFLVLPALLMGGGFLLWFKRRQR